MNENLVGRCGLYCGSCFVYRACRDSERLQRTIAERMNLKPEEITCEGCQTVLTSSKAWVGEDDFPLVGGKRCKIVLCLQAKGLDFCFQCSEYPDCGKFRFIQEDSLRLGEDLMENLNRIRSGEMKEWLEEEDKKWRCQSCGRPMAPFLGECHWCGVKLRSLGRRQEG